MTRKDPSAPAPEFSRLDPAAKAEWRRLDGAGLIADSEPKAVAAYCYAYARWIEVGELVTRLEESGRVNWTDIEGRLRLHPAVNMKARLATDLDELAQTLGIDHTNSTGHRPTRIVVLDEGPPEPSQ